MRWSMIRFAFNILLKKKSSPLSPGQSLKSLDGLKARPDIGFDARQATRIIEKMRSEKHDFLDIFREISWDGIEFLDSGLNDHRIIAAANALKKKYERVDLVSKDAMMRIKAREFGFIAEDYYRDQVQNEE